MPNDLIIQAVYVMPKVKISKQDIENLLKQCKRKKEQRTELVYK